MRNLLFISLTVLSSIVYTPLGNLSEEVVGDLKDKEGSEAYKDKFAVLVGGSDYVDENPNIRSVLGENIDVDLRYKKLLVEVPLVRCDYYYGKHINATAGVNEVNRMPVLEPGDSIGLINDGYLTLLGNKGYVSPGSDFMYASGVCWTTSTLGFLMDEANKTFSRKYEIPLFTFNSGDRLPHPESYATYRNTNYGYGYSVVKIPNGSSLDFRFTVNPELANNPRFKNLELKIVMISSIDNENAFMGQSIGAYIKTNINF